MYSEERKAQIIELIEKHGSINVNVLAERFETSRETIRRDLNDLQKHGVLKRTHGGAVAENHAGAAFSGEYPIGIRGIRQVTEKNKICAKAASFIEEGDTLFVDNSSTLIYLPQYIPPELHVTIITNSIDFLLAVSKVPHYNLLLICLGGIFKSDNLSVHGSIAAKNAEEYYPSKAFFSCAGISPHHKVADSSIHEIEIKRMMIERAQETFLLADCTKLQKTGQMHLCGFEAVDHLITDDKISSSNVDVSFLESNGIDVMIA